MDLHLERGQGHTPKSVLTMGFQAPAPKFTPLPGNRAPGPKQPPASPASEGAWCPHCQEGKPCPHPRSPSKASPGVGSCGAHLGPTPGSFEEGPSVEPRPLKIAAGEKLKPLWGGKPC